ncbi:DUF4974 domain-containing protein [Chitinophaga lutea]|uniref:DUF4974 domain-containing protein n=1 Tax=Chitinophaga lutea TaxID=2488634 RepID=A0A3N4PL14_9BACT|nr:FecR domain-containing protein [Chitinophaga lutea]RPE09372.1 DUF4974 domain-containing protein [Chitinophaga lutea]
MPDRFELEELVINDSFINYCFRRNEADVAFWERYLLERPAEAATVAEAKELVMGISLMLQEPAEELPVMETVVTPINPRRPLRMWAAAAAVILLVGTAGFFLFRPAAQQQLAQQADTAQVYTTAMAEKKTVRLADSTSVILNAGSELTVEKGFGRHNRSVKLKGEAFFQVEHDAALPFVVKTEGYDVRVLGTVFNVKAYPGEKKSETSLICGKVEIQLPDAAGSKVLRPKEKFVISRDLEPLPAAKKKEPQATAILPLSYNRKNVNIETAWSDNRLVFEDETFTDMREKLERWFDVRIIFEDELIEQYRFTATFEKENIVQVMKALQASYPFTCSMEGKTVKISNQHSRRQQRP